MTGTILENLSGRKLAILVSFLLLGQLACFLVGLMAPNPATTQGTLATVCLDENPEAEDNSRWFTRDCKRINLANMIVSPEFNANNLVFVMQMPLYELDFSRWQQNLVGILQVDMVYLKEQKLLDPVIELTIDARLAYSDKKPDGSRTPWEYYNHAEEKRFMECTFDHASIKGKEKNGYPYDCTMVPLFELGALYHDYYLLNLRLPYNVSSYKNTGLGKVEDIYLHIIHMNGGFTKIWLSLKTFFFPVIIGIMFWFWRRVRKLNRSPALLECVIMSLGSALAFLNLPIEYLSLIFEMPYMLLLSDIRQGIFYAMLLSFWLIFAGEHLLIQESSKKNTIQKYWKHLTTIVTGCFCLLIFDLCERGVQLVNPFYSIWVTPVGTNLALSFIILAGISAGIYFIFLCSMIWRVFQNISTKRSLLPSMSQARRLHYEGIIYRFKFLMLATVICAAVTIVSFILSQISEGQNKWDETMDIELTSALHTGVYGMWNIYICAMLILYAPSHKRWLSEPSGVPEEELEFNNLPTNGNPNEISSLTSFATKVNAD
ncbi:wnt ligand secretion mediator [Leptinotarsa decemlineata]|uniref:wnt ligand secretion mediator n=1 Tax=Leptinotarsa decemlineata TaxID=7539 RepID=UPI003D309AF4